MQGHQTEYPNPFSFVIFGLLLKCPFGCSTISCPLEDLRSTDVSEENKYHLAERLNSFHTYKLLKEHNRCFRDRMRRSSALHMARTKKQTLDTLELLLNSNASPHSQDLQT